MKNLKPVPADKKKSLGKLPEKNAIISQSQYGLSEEMKKGGKVLNLK
jgi:hypothetical protein